MNILFTLVLLHWKLYLTESNILILHHRSTSLNFTAAQTFENFTLTNNSLSEVIKFREDQSSSDVVSFLCRTFNLVLGELFHSGKNFQHFNLDLPVVSYYLRLFKYHFRKPSFRSIKPEQCI